MSDFYLRLEATVLELMGFTVRSFAIVISPLTSFMINQVNSLRHRGVSLTIVFSGRATCYRRRSGYIRMYVQSADLCARSAGGLQMELR